MKLDEMYPSPWIKVEDLKEGDVALTISAVAIEAVGSEKEEKPVVSFAQTDKKLSLNKTNAVTIASLYGEETDKWKGKHVALYATKTQFAGKSVDGIRVRDKAPAKALEAAPF